jgi:hypothetical protein
LVTQNIGGIDDPFKDKPGMQCDLSMRFFLPADLMPRVINMCIAGFLPALIRFISFPSRIGRKMQKYYL